MISPNTDLQAPAELPPGYDVFFSYDHDDAAWAQKLAGALRDRGLRVWIDSGEIRAAERWAEEIEEGLRASRVYAMIVTRRALSSRWVRDEYYVALAIGNTDGVPLIVPVLVEDVELPGFLSIRQWVDFRTPDRFDLVVKHLVESIAAESPGLVADDMNPLPPVSASPAPSASPTPPLRNAEIRYLERAMARERRTMREMWGIRGVALLLSPALVGLTGAGWAAGEFALASVFGMGFTLFVGLIAWGATLPAMRSAAGRENRLQFLRDKLVQCQVQRDASCDPLYAEFWRLVHGDKPGRAGA
ncbi:MAG TPA: toll/interleukin-1 receptor domain-containing protein [Longimicrobium sp.]|nr:toll/interleukin-1 receptor domain-containing protein [Longimicrobium sp.]